MKSFKFELERPFDFLPGQFCDIKLTSADGVEATRSYSIASAPGGKLIEFGIQILEDGEVSGHMDKMEPGDTVQLLGPLGGYFVWDPDLSGGREILLIGGGSGIVPLVSMIRHRVRLGQGSKLYALFSVRSLQDLAWRDEIVGYSLLEHDAGVRVAVTLSREWEDDWGGDVGRIDTEKIERLLKDVNVSNLDTYICGRSEFVESVGSSLKSIGVKEAIRTERFG